MKKPVEIEIKLPLESVAKGRALLRKHGFKIFATRVFEENLVLDNEARSLYNLGLLLRVRRAGKTVTCTSKGPESVGGPHKRRAENEFQASDFNSILAVFATIGFREAFRYEKYRTEFSRSGEDGHVTLDETPIGAFMELEGSAAWINRTAKLLGFPQETWITLSYARLYNQWCEDQGVIPTNMKF